jgi:hypothetical protein
MSIGIPRTDARSVSGTDLEISDNAFSEPGARRHDCGSLMRKIDRHTYLIGEPPKVRVTWRCETCETVEIVLYWYDGLTGEARADQKV